MLLIKHSFYADNMPGNCGVMVAYRLVGSYRDKSAAEQKYNKLGKQGLLRPIAGLQRATKRNTIANMIHCLQRAEGDAARARAYPLEWAYAHVLEDIHTSSYCMVMLTDTEDGSGDGHDGPFSPRHFAQWLIDERFMSGNMTEATRYPGVPDRERRVYGWCLVPNKNAITDYLRRMKIEIHGQLMAYNKDPLVKEASKGETKEKQELKAIFDDFDAAEIEARVLATAARGRVHFSTMPVPAQWTRVAPPPEQEQRVPFEADLDADAEDERRFEQMLTEIAMEEEYNEPEEL